MERAAPPLTRRDFLKTAAAAALAPALPAWGRAPAVRSFSFAYFSDTHVALDRNAHECRALLRELAGRIRPAFAINGGDVTDYGWQGEYDNYRWVLHGTRFPVHHVPGNHDVRWSPLGMQIYTRYLGPPYRAFSHGGCRFVLLDTSVPLSHWGHYESAQLRWLEADLRGVGRETPVFVVTHHWVGRDRVMVDNEEALRRVLEPYNVKAILNGHGHQDLLWHWDGMLGTMNKGLYQGSYQRVDVDAEAGEVRLWRRTAEDPQLRPLATVALGPDRATRPVWALGAAPVRAGDPLRIDPSTAAEYRWNEGAWSPIPPDGVLTAALAGGANVLALRQREGGVQAAFVQPVDAAAPVLRPRWQRRLTGGVMSHLRLEGGLLYVSAMDGSVTALRAADGEVAWSAMTGGYCHSSPTVADGRVIVGSADGYVYAFDAADGRRLWRRRTGGPVYASAAVAGGTAVIPSGDGVVYGLDVRDGGVRWRFTLPPGVTAFAQSPVATDGVRAYVGAWDRHLYALEVESGREAWRRRCTDRSFAYSPAIGGPAVRGGWVYVPSNDNVLHAFHAASGEPGWKYTSPGDKVGYSSPVLVGDRIYVGCLGAAGEVRCISATDGREVWMAATGAEIYDSSPAVSDGYVAIGSVNGTLSLIDAGTGIIRAQHRLPPGHCLSSPAAADGRVYAASFSDVVTAFTIAE
ncbi:MAG TPA: PQQ-binding-like beta-propeller repeat protein [Longimicrobium sp.]|nr:PQQ-binding-like beta-propeller repeat protein [Longimicrobium sp.]